MVGARQGRPMHSCRREWSPVMGQGWTTTPLPAAAAPARPTAPWRAPWVMTQGSAATTPAGRTGRSWRGCLAGLCCSREIHLALYRLPTVPVVTSSALTAGTAQSALGEPSRCMRRLQQAVPGLQMPGEPRHWLCPPQWQQLAPQMMQGPSALTAACWGGHAAKMSHRPEPLPLQSSPQAALMADCCLTRASSPSRPGCSHHRGMIAALPGHCQLTGQIIAASTAAPPGHWHLLILIVASLSRHGHPVKAATW
mmetsp:Transcript_10902/g.32671  ORF Transcript_10902/g.32671 Transcript_10902/m.32671 type:complete len:253 (-) Transcript_10902:826-1584(-)